MPLDAQPGARHGRVAAATPGWATTTASSEISAALGEVQMRRLDEILARRRRRRRPVRPGPGRRRGHPPAADADRATASWFVYVIRLADRFSQADRDAVMARLRKAGVGCNPYFVPIHLQPYIREMLGTQAGRLPRHRAPSPRGPSPCRSSAGLTEAQVQTVAQALNSALSAVGKRA